MNERFHFYQLLLNTYKRKVGLYIAPLIFDKIEKIIVVLTVQNNLYI